MKKQNKLWFILIPIILIAIIGSVFFVTQNSGIGNSNIQIIARPVFGYIKCEPAVNPVRYSTQITIPKEGSTISGKFFGDVSDFQITVNYPSEPIYVNAKYVRYRICNVDGSGCRTNWVDALNTDNAVGSGSVTLPSVTQSEQIQIYYEIGCLLTGDCGKYYPKRSSRDTAKFTAVYKPYQLFRYNVFDSTTGQPFSETCDNPISNVEAYNSKNPNSKFMLLISTSVEGQTARSSYTPRLAPNEGWTFLSGFVLSPMETETYNGQMAYCTGLKMYGFDSIKTTDGKEYAIPDLSKEIASVTCCNGDVKLNAVCQNHAWISTASENLQCSAINPCPIVSWTTDINDNTRKTIFRQTCVSGKCTTETKKVDCATSYACPEGFSCSPTEYKCVKTAGTGGGLIPETCGNNVCEGNEDYNKCPLDCKNPNVCGCWVKNLIGTGCMIPNFFCKISAWFKSKVLIASIIMGVLAFLVALIFLPQILKKQKIKTQPLIPFIIAIVLGVLVFFLTMWLWWLALLLIIVLIVIKVIL